MRLSSSFRCVLFGLFWLLLVTCARMPEGVPPQPPTVVRIGLETNAPQVEIQCTRPWTISRSSNKSYLDKEDGIVLQRVGNEITAVCNGKTILNGDHLWLTCLERKGTFLFNDLEYRGGMEVFPSKDGGLTVVNTIDLEDYLRGVVSAEMGRQPKERIEGLKAQAIAARSYVLANMGRRKPYGFDFFDDIRDQIYYGTKWEDKLSDKAILETSGLVATYNGRPISAFYCSNCGGHTASIEEAWGEEPVPYLNGIRDAFEGEDFGKDSRNHRWTETWTRQELEAILNTSLPQEIVGLEEIHIGLLQDIAVVDRSVSGRVQTLRIGTLEATFWVHKDRIRSVLRRSEDGHPILRSTYFMLKLERDLDGTVTEIKAIGGGNGHGVGMCQAGAMGMADQGYTAEDILKHYYQGIEISRWPSNIRVASVIKNWEPDYRTKPQTVHAFSMQIFATEAETKARSIAAEARLLTDAPVEVVHTEGLWKVYVGSAPSREALYPQRTLFREWGFSDCWIADR